MTIDESETLKRYRVALEQIVKQKHTPRAYRHTKFEQLVRIAEDAIRNDEQGAGRRPR